MLIETILSALVPVGIEGVKQIITRFSGGVKPATIDEQIKLDQSEISKLEALSKLDNPYGTPSQWVIDLRASSRYIAAIAVIIGGIGVNFVSEIPEQAKLAALEAVGIVFGFLFGNRVLVNRK